MSWAAPQLSLEICPATNYTDSINCLVTEATVQKLLRLSREFVSRLREQIDSVQIIWGKTANGKCMWKIPILPVVWMSDSRLQKTKKQLFNTWLHLRFHKLHYFSTLGVFSTYTHAWLLHTNASNTRLEILIRLLTEALKRAIWTQRWMFFHILLQIMTMSIIKTEIN